MPVASPRGLAGGRVSVDTEESIFNSALSVVTPLSSDTYWRDFNLDSSTFDRISITRLMELLIDLSPDVSDALWQFLRFCNPGFEVKAKRPGSEDVDQKAQAALDAFLSNLHGPFTANNVVPVDVVISSLFLSAFIRGAFCTELVLDQAGRMPLELATPDPAFIRFEKVKDPTRGYVHRMFQWQGGKKVELERPTISYIPIDPLPGKPNGRAIAQGALFSSLFLIGLLHDLRRVVAQQGYPRLDLSINLEKLLLLMPKNLAADPTKTKEWVEGAINEIKNLYSGLEPDDAYIHLDVVSVNRPVGALDASSLSASKALIEALERFTIRGFKSQPILMGAVSVDQASSNRQWEIHAASIKSIQHYAEFMLERQCGLALRVQGIQADVEWRFAELRAAELLRDEQYRALNIKNTAAEYDMGYINQEEAAMKVVKHKPDQEKPRKAPDTSAADMPTGGVAADPGSERSIETDDTFNLVN